MTESDNILENEPGEGMYHFLRLTVSASHVLPRQQVSDKVQAALSRGNVQGRGAGFRVLRGAG